MEVDPHERLIHPLYIRDKGEMIKVGWFALTGVSEQVIENGQARLIRTRAEFKALGSGPLENTDPARSGIFVPYKIGDELRGVITLQNTKQDDAFDNDDLRLLTTLANSMSIALANAQLFAETQQRNAELAVINTVQDGLVAELDLNGIYQLIGDTIERIFDTQVTAILGLDLDERLIKPIYVREKGQTIEVGTFPLSGVTEHVVDTGQARLLRTQAEFLELGSDAVEDTGASFSSVFVPFKIGDALRGVITLQNIEHENAFDEDDLRLLQTLANSMSIALANAQLFGETQQRNAELAVITSVQQALASELEI